MSKVIALLILSLWSFTLPVIAQITGERAYVQTDRHDYMQGETIHFKAYILDGDTLKSKHLFVGIWDAAMKKLDEVCLPVIDGTVAGSLDVPTDLKTSQVFLRAYTDKAILQNETHQFIQPLLGSTFQATSPEDNGISFFPEGGKLTHNAVNYVAFKGPADFNGIIRNSKGDHIVEIKPMKNGMGMFRYRPVEDETYYCHGNIKGRDTVIALPLPERNGIAIHADQRNDTLFFDLDNGKTGDTSVLKPRVKLMINNEIAYVIDMDMTGHRRFSYFIPLRGFKPGLAELRVTDNKNMTVAKRPVMIAWKQFDRNVEMEMVKKDLQPRAENIIRLFFRDTTLRNVSVSITDAAYSGRSPRPGLISAKVHPDLSTAMVDKDIDPGTMDLVLLTLGDLAEQEHGTTRSAPPIPNYLQLSGQVKQGRKLVANKEVIVAIRTSYGGKDLHKVITDSAGRFILDGLIIYGDAYIYCKLPGSDEALPGEFKLTLPAMNEDSAFFHVFRKKAGTITKQQAGSSGQNNISRKDTLVFGERGIMLEEVVVKTSYKQQEQKRMEEVEKKYLQGTGFAGYSTMAETLDVLNDPQAAKLFDLFTYIATNMRSIRQLYVRGQKELIYPIRGVHGDTIIQTYFLNGNKIHRDLMDNIRLSDVALIKFIPMLGSEPGLPPAVAIFLKKPGDEGYWEKDKYKEAEKLIKGYRIPKEFQAPDYSIKETVIQKDLRKTLLWLPYTTVEKAVAQVRFYNNDDAKRFRIVVEGIGADGTPVYFEKILE